MSLQKKSDRCKGCPLWGDGFGYVADDLPEGVEAIVVMDQVRELDEKTGVPFSDRAGKNIETRYFQLAGLERGANVGLAHVLRCRTTRQSKGKFYRTTELPSGAVLQEAVDHCRSHDVIPPGVKVIVAVGALAWSVFHKGPVHEWRGYINKEDV